MYVRNIIIYGNQGVDRELNPRVVMQLYDKMTNGSRIISK